MPRLVLEGAFLLLVAVLAGLADLAAAWIVLVMAVAWALVVLTEWAAAAKRARWRLDEIAPPADRARSRPPTRPGPWDMPVVEATVVESGPDPESKTIVAKLPVEPDAVPEAEPAPKRLRGLRRRRKPRRDEQPPIRPPIPGRRSLGGAVAAACARHGARRLGAADARRCGRRRR